MLGGQSLKIKKVPAMEANKTIFASMRSLGSKRDNRVQGTLTFRGVQHLEDADPSPRRTREMTRSILERTMLSVAVFTMDRAHNALMPPSFVVI